MEAVDYCVDHQLRLFQLQPFSHKALDYDDSFVAHCIESLALFILVNLYT